MLRRGPLKVDLQLVACDGHRRRDLELAAAGRLEQVRGFEAAVGELGDRRPHDSLGIPVELV